MAGIDTRNKRFSMLSLGLDFGRVRPNPDGAFSDSDKDQFLPLYAGIDLGDTLPTPSTTSNRIVPFRPIWRRWKLLHRQGE